MIHVTRETYDGVIEDIKPLLTKHWQEIARNRERIELNPDYGRYKELENRGALFIFTAREDGKILGYAIYFVGPHLHYRDHKWALSDIFWVTPERRGIMVGKRLFGLAEKVLRENGVSVMHTTSKIAHPSAGRLLEHFGHEHIEAGHAKVLLE